MIKYVECESCGEQLELTDSMIERENIDCSECYASYKFDGEFKTMENKEIKEVNPEIVKPIDVKKKASPPKKKVVTRSTPVAMATRTPKRSPAPVLCKSVQEARALVEHESTIKKIKSIGSMNVSKMANTLQFAISENPDLLKCTKESIGFAVLDAARAGMYPDGKSAVLVPYFDKKSGSTKAKFTPMTRGIISASIRKGVAKKFTAREVYAGDNFHVRVDDFGDMVFEHEIDHLKPKGDIVAAYAIILLPSGERITELLRKEDLDAIESVAASKNIWGKWKGEMCRKSAIRRASKYLPDADEEIATLYDIELRSEIDLPSYSEELEKTKRLKG